jgi:hypothetical protein
MAVASAKLIGAALASSLVLLSSVAAAAAAPAAGSSARPGAFCCRNAPPWRGVTEFKLKRDGWFVDVEATSRDSAWAVGDTLTQGPLNGGVAAHWNGNRWRMVTLPISGFVPVSVSASKGSSVWIFGYQVLPDTTTNNFPGYALVWTAGAWQVHQLPSAGAEWDVLGDLQSVVFGDDDVWVTGNGQNDLGETTGNIMWNWNGSGWTGYRLHVAGVRNVSASSGDNVWVAAQRTNGRTIALRWDGVAWRKVAVPSILIASVVVDSQHNVWLAGAAYANHILVGAVEHWNGSHWSRTLLDPVLNPNEIASTDGHGGVWFSDFAHESRGVWYVPTALPLLRGCSFGLGAGMVAAIPGTSAAWFAGACAGPAIAIDGHL